MAWQRIDDNAKAWELFKAGLLWFGAPPDDVFHYDSVDSWRREEWMQTQFNGTTHHRPNYILLED